MIVTLARLQELYPSVAVEVSSDGSVITVSGCPFVNSGRKGITCAKHCSLTNFGRGVVEFTVRPSSKTSDTIIQTAKIQFDVTEPKDSSTPSHTMQTRAPIPAPVLEDGFLRATVCVASKNASSLPEDASDTIVMGESTRALVTVNVSNILEDKNGNLCLSSRLRFTFHRDIAEEAIALLHKAWEEEQKQDQEETESSVSPASPIPSCIIPIPMFSSDGSTSSGNWADDADEMVFAIPAPTPAFLPSEDEVSALSGAFDNVLTRQEQKAQRVEEQRLKEAQCHEAVDPVTQNAEITHPLHPIFVKNMDRKPLDAMVALAKKRGIHLNIMHSGRVFFLDVSPLLAKKVLTMNVAPWGNEIRCGIRTNDGTFRHGCIANVDQGSYMAVVTMFPEMGKIVQEVMQVRDELNVRNLPPSHQGLLPMPKLVWYIVPIIGADGSIMAYQQVPRYA